MTPLGDKTTDCVRGVNRVKLILSTTVCTLAAVALLAGTAAPVHAAGISERDRLSLLDSATRLTNNALKYLHTTYWEANYHYEVVGGMEMALPAVPLTNEASIRPQASALCATALMLNTGRYDPATTGVSANEARRRVVAWSNALALSYNEQRWGKGWQSALWTYYWAFGSKQVWSSLPPATRTRVTAAVTAEANYLLTIPPPFYADKNGKVLSPGDSKSEENAWNASLLFMAAKMFLAQPSAAKWDAQARWYMIAAYASPQQIGTDRRITGSNINSDGTVINHGYINVDYFTCQAEFAMKSHIVARQTGTSAPWECSNNLALVWRALTRLRFTGGTIYRLDPARRPSADVYYPYGCDYSSYRKFNLAQMDVEAFLQHVDKQAFAWANAHLKYTLAQQARHVDGHAFAAGENANPGDEPFLAVTGAEMVARLLYR